MDALVPPLVELRDYALSMDWWEPAALVGLFLLGYYVEYVAAAVLRALRAFEQRR